MNVITGAVGREIKMDKRRRIKPEERKMIYKKFDGHCAYCGKEIDYKDMQVDHIKPLRLGGSDDTDNMFPACRRCNHYKRGNTLEGFRNMIENIPLKLHRDNYIYKVAIDYDFVPRERQDIKFYFEKKKGKKSKPPKTGSNAIKKETNTVILKVEQEKSK